MILFACVGIYTRKHCMKDVESAKQIHAHARPSKEEDAGGVQMPKGAIGGKEIEDDESDHLEDMYDSNQGTVISNEEALAMRETMGSIGNAGHIMV